LSYATVKRLKKQSGKSILDGKKKDLSKKSCRKCKLNEGDIDYITTFFIENASYFNFKHFYEYFVVNQMGYDISYSTLLRIFKERKIGSHYSRKQTIKVYNSMRKHNIENLNVVSNGDISNEKKKLHMRLKYEVTPKYSHPYMPKVKYFGEILETDASVHLWSGDKKYNLHIFIDKSTAMILGAYFDEQETLNGYYHAFKQVLKNYGIPYKIISDKRQVFRSTEQGEKTTNFMIMCKYLGIDLKPTSIAEHKATVERTFRTLQSRLSAELKFLNITSKKELNEYVIEYIKKHNQIAPPKLNDTLNKFVGQEFSEKELDRILSIFKERVIVGHCINYEKKKYIPLNHEGNRIFIHNRTKVVVGKSLSDEIFMFLEDEVFDLEEISEVEVASINFNEKKAKEKKEKYIPPKDHPWRKIFYKIFLELRKQK
ncbi:DDE-type integrase/transposase/recombinase, partial [Oceanivirga salmonicida]|uniref:DDE-type integrase/transposase/recombinase n=1 Tax=Oceanivirga salmonicida TaxID=1769291 RepID=UPI0012E0D008